MVSKSDEFIKSRVIWKAGEYKLTEEFTYWYDDLPETRKKDITAYIPGEAGLPVLLFTRPGKEWTLLCTRLLIGFENDHAHVICFDDISELIPLMKTREGHLIPNQEQYQMVITHTAGNELLFRTFQGGDFYALWNILLLVRRLNGASWKINLCR